MPATVSLVLRLRSWASSGIRLDRRSGLAADESLTARRLSSTDSVGNTFSRSETMAIPRAAVWRGRRPATSWPPNITEPDTLTRSARGNPLMARTVEVLPAALRPTMAMIFSGGTEKEIPETPTAPVL